MESNGERVCRDRQQRRDLCEVAAQACEQEDGCHASANRCDLQTVDRKAVIEAGGAEVGEQRLLQIGGAAEDDCLDYVASLPLEPERAVGREPAPDAVADSRDAAAPARDAPRLRTQDGMNPLPPQPSRLVEALRRPG